MQLINIQLIRPRLGRYKQLLISRYEEWLRKNGKLKTLANRQYKRMFGRNINWQNPEDLNQWINKLEFEGDTSLWPMLADKYAVREFIASQGFGQFLVPLLAVWDTPDEIEFTNLPTSFVMKMNNGCGDVLIVKDKRTVELDQIKETFWEHYKKPFGAESSEPHYLKIKPRIIVEQLLEVNKQSIESTSLVDYKCWCFNGKPTYCMTISNRLGHSFDMDLYDIETWDRKEAGRLVYSPTLKKNKLSIPKPANLQIMQQICVMLSKGHPQIRVDFYEVDGKLFIGELTLTSGSGKMPYFTPEFQKSLGSFVKAYFEENQ